ncbi:MAG: ASKHA domain-containing protein, partial [Phycisphaerales bacterium]
MQHFKITFQPDSKWISIHEGATLLEAAHQAAIILNTVCGGKGSCRKCALRLEPSGEEVLACQYKIDSDLTVTVPQSSRFFEQKILEHGIETKSEFQPDVYKNYQAVAGQNKILGLAVDIGTTTIVAKLIDLTTGKCLDTQTDYNPQMRYGDDVISRIDYAQTQTKLAELQLVLIDCLNSLIEELCDDPNQIYELAAVGNTTMSHIFFGFPITQLGQAPYKAHTLDAHQITAKELGIAINPDAKVRIVENIAGFVGSDSVAAALAAGMDLVEQLTLLVDIGTNGELVLGTKQKLYAASCAAGPALEGAKIDQGSRAVDGAIEAVVINEGDVDVDVIGDSPASSICGSGLIDAVAVMLELGVLDHTGRFVEPARLKDKLPPAVLRRLVQKDNQPAFVLAYTDDSDKPSVTLTQKDIRELQLAKAAIRTGISLLLEKVRLNDSDIEQVLLSGAFGNYIKKTSALRIGLLPDVATDKIHFVGNAASSGAQTILINTAARDLAG